MALGVDLLEPSQEPAYEAMLRSIVHSFLYTSLSYRDFLETILPDSEPRYLVASDAGRVAGVLPAFLKRNRMYGNVLNSLPFFGSHGGVWVAPGREDSDEVKQMLIQGFYRLAKENDVVLSTMIAHPLHNDDVFYRVHLRPNYHDDRIGQITLLPEHILPSENVESLLLARFHPKTRNSIRKARKVGVTVSHSGNVETLKHLERFHREHMEEIGGRAKPWAIFQGIRDVFTYDRDYRVYTATKDGVLIGALLVFFYNRSAEYFVPSTRGDCREYQPMSLMVFEAMQEACRRGMRYWNWGGTWKTQSGVYRFKERWGTTDFPYHYYVCQYETDSPLFDLEAEEVLREYPYFFVRPFTKVSSDV